MSVKLLLLKSGEDIVADVQEMLVDEKVVGYYLKYPCRVKLVSDFVKTEEGPVPTRIQITPWMPLSKDMVISVPCDWVVTITEPVTQVKEMYKNSVEQYETRKSEVGSTDEQSNSHNPD